MPTETQYTASQTEIRLPELAKLEWSTGSQGALIWIEELERTVGSIRNSQSKSELLQIIRNGKHYEIEWKTKQQVRAQFPDLEEEQIAATLEASNKISARELVQQQECRVAVNAFLHSVMGKSSLDTLMNDEIYNHNDLNNKDPAVAWSRIMATHVTQRDGSGTQKQYTAVNTMVSEFAVMSQDHSESITEYLRRYERSKKALLNAGLDVEQHWLDNEEKKVVKFLYSLDQSKYGRLIRDVANLVVPIPGSIRELIKVAKERKEIKTATVSQRAAVLATVHRSSQTTGEENKRDPLVPYPRYDSEEWAKFTAAERTKISKHNANIRKAAAALPQSPHDSTVRPRKQKSRVSTALLTTNMESDDSDLDTNIVLFTSARNRGQNDDSNCEDNDSDMPPLLDMSEDEEEPVKINTPPNRRTPTLNPEGVHQPPTRGINVSDDIVSPEKGSRGAPPVSIPSRVMGCDNYNGPSSVSDRVVQNTCAIIDLTGVNQTPSPDSTKRVDHTALNQNITTIDASVTESMKNAKIECESEVLVASEWDETMDALEPTHLAVQQSKYRACNEYRHVVPVGRALTCETIIKAGQKIGTFNGTHITMQDAEEMSPTRGAYLLDLSMDNDKNGKILDCYHNTLQSTPICKLSMSNTAEGLYDRVTDTSLTSEHNNAAVTVVPINEQPVAIMYAIRDIPRGEEIMWDYNVHHDNDSSPPSPISTPIRNMFAEGQHAEERLSAAIKTITHNISRMDGHPQLAFTTSDSDITENADRCLATTQRDSFDENFVLLDCASGTHLCISPTRAINKKPCKRGHITGIEGANSAGTRYDESCEFVDPAFGRMPLAIGAAANILSLATARDDGFTVLYNNETDEFTLISPSGGKYTFGRLDLGAQGRAKSILGTQGKAKSKFYVMSLETNTTPSEEETTILYSSHSIAEQAETGVQSTAVEHPDEMMQIREGSIATIRHNQTKYTKKQNRDAERGRDFVASIGYPPLATAVQQVRAMRNCPISEQDIRRSYEIYGVPVQHVKGSTKKKNGTHVAIDPAVNQVQADQSMELDLMFFGGNMFLVCILTPLEFSFCAPIKDKSVGAINDALEWIISESASRGYDVQWVKSDNEPAITTSRIAQMLAERRIATDQTAPGQHAARAERRIQFIKAKARSLTSHLPYKVSRELLKYAAIAANRFTNMQTASSSQSPLTPREKFLGRQSDFKRDVGMPFGSYCQCTQVNTDNTHGPRTEACIFLYPKESTTGSYYVLRLKNHRAVVRSNAILMPMPDAIIDRMDTQATEDTLDLNETDDGIGQERAEPAQREDVSELHRTTRFMPTNAHTRQQTEHQPSTKIDDPIDRAAETSTSTAGLQSTEQEERRTPTKEKQVTQEPNGPRESPHSDAPRRSARIEAIMEAQAVPDYWDINDPLASYHTVLLNLTCKQAEKKHGQVATDSITGELQQLLDKDFAEPLRPENTTPEMMRTAICSKMFVKQKLKADGSVDKVKSRLVARGDMQDRSRYMGEDLSATTADCLSVLTVLAIAAHERRHVLSADVGGAYLNASLGKNSPEVLMKIDKRLSTILAEESNEYKGAVREDGTILVRLKKCLYGCIESAAKWQDHLTDTLIKNGLQCNPHDTSIMNKTCDDGSQLTVAVYVDDLLITSKNKEAATALLKSITKRYKDVKSHEGSKLEYLGMSIDMTEEGSAIITMSGMEDRIVEDSALDNSGKATTSPASNNLFEIDEQSIPLEEKERKKFHAMVARLLYLSKRVRPECLLAVAFLTTRVLKATQEDAGKLQRVLKYLRDTRGRGIRLTPGTTGIVASGHFDAAYGVHPDGKSHTGACLMLGDAGPVLAESCRQQIVTKSSTEAELVALSDSTNQLLHLRQFLLAQGHPQGPATIYQDNMSCMALQDKGRSTSKRTRHINIRYFWTKEQCTNGEITIVHRTTELMGAANVMTKPTQGSQFENERYQLTNYENSVTKI